jgi:PAS domain S-box-containing protein
MNIARLSDGTQVHVNDSCLKLFGLSRDEALGHTSEELGLFADVTCRERFVKLFREQGYVRDFRVELLDRSGRRFTALFSSDRMDVDGTDGYILNTIIDLTGIGGEAREEKS